MTNDSMPPPPPSSPPPGPGPERSITSVVTTGTRIIGTYEIEKLINSGGMGEVYRGVNIHNGEPVAIKIVLAALAHDPKIVALFQKEATVLGRLAHEAIVRYHVFTNDPAIGRPCMVMEFVEGTSMSDRIEQGSMPVEDVRILFRRVASGLDKAHRAGVVHRDLSPDNVILEGGAVEHAKLIDFGIAKSSSIGGGTLLQGQFAGKFNWVSPEQLGAFGGGVDGRSDIYSLALLIAAASRGKVVDMGASIVDAVGRRASVPDLAGVDPALMPLLNWMLQPDPAYRPDSMATVIAALDNPALVPPLAGSEGPDPNRTVIGGSLPSYQQPGATVTGGFAPPPPPGSYPATPYAPTSPPVNPQQSYVPMQGLPPAPPTSQPPQATGGSWGTPATVIAPAQHSMPPGAAPTSPPGQYGGQHTGGFGMAAPTGEAEDVSPFGAPSATTPPSQPGQPGMATATPTKSKGGLIAVLVLLAALGGGGGAWYAGLFGSGGGKTPVVDSTDAGTGMESGTAATDGSTGTETATDTTTGTGTSTETTPSGDPTPEPEGDPTPPATGGSETASDATNPPPATEDGTQAGDMQAGGTTAEGGTATQPAEAGTDTATAPESTAPEGTAAGTATGAATGTAAQPDALDWLANATMPACTLLLPQQPAGAGQAVSFDGFATTANPLEEVAKKMQAATGSMPDVTVSMINETQCPVLDFVRRHSGTADGAAGAYSAPLTVSLGNVGGPVKSGATVQGEVTGAAGRPVAIFLVSEAGGATNLKQWVSTASDGKASFAFTVSLAPGAPPAPQLILAIATDKPLTKLDAVPNGVTVKSLMPFVDVELSSEGLKASPGLKSFLLQN